LYDTSCQETLGSHLPGSLETPARQLGLRPAVFKTSRPNPTLRILCKTTVFKDFGDAGCTWGDSFGSLLIA